MRHNATQKKSIKATTKIASKRRNRRKTISSVICKIEHKKLSLMKHWHDFRIQANLFIYLLHSSFVRKLLFDAFDHRYLFTFNFSSFFVSLIFTPYFEFFPSASWFPSSAGSQVVNQIFSLHIPLYLITIFLLVYLPLISVLLQSFSLPQCCNYLLHLF